MVRIRLFGGVHAASDGGEPLDVGTARSQTVLAALALSPGSAVPVSRLVDLVWGDAPPQTAEKALQWHIARLRQGLGPAGDRPYGCGVPPRRRARRGRRRAVPAVPAATATSRPRWPSGREPAGRPRRAGSDRDGGRTGRTVAGRDVEVDLERRIESDPQGAIGPLTELSRRHPFREGLWALLMTALYRVGTPGRRSRGVPPRPRSSSSSSSAWNPARDCASWSR